MIIAVSVVIGVVAAAAVVVWVAAVVTWRDNVRRYRALRQLR